MDVEVLLAPVSEDDPVGPDTIDFPARQRIQEYFDRDEGGVAANEWPGIVKEVVALAKQTRDMWIAVKLTEGGARMGSLETIDDGAQLLAGLVERYWPIVHPKLEDVDFEGRANTCASLAKIREFLGPLRRTTLFESRIANFTGADLEKISLEGEKAENYGMFRVMLEQMRTEGKLEDTSQQLIDRLDSIRDALRRADTVLTENSGSETSTNFQPTYEAIESIRKLIVPHAGEPKVDDEPVEETSEAGAAEAGVAVAAAALKISGKVENRDDVLKALDAIAEYYRTREPSSPVPVLLTRLRQWVGMDFLDVIADLAPTGLMDARAILLSKADQAAS